MYYTTADVAKYTANKVVDLPTFISAVGGNLGLFLGVSFLGTFFWIYEEMETRGAIFSII